MVKYTPDNKLDQNNTNIDQSCVSDVQVSSHYRDLPNLIRFLGRAEAGEGGGWIQQKCGRFNKEILAELFLLFTVFYNRSSGTISEK